MITTDRQLKAARLQAEKLRQAIDTFDEQAASDTGTHPHVVRAHLTTLHETHAEVSEDIATYELLTTAPPHAFKVTRLTELPDVLIKARIAQCLTQGELATHLGMKEQQIQRYEASLYHGASLERLSEVAEALGITWAAEAKLSRPQRAASRHSNKSARKVHDGPNIRIR